MTIFRRLLLLWLFMFWQGGFMFYGTVVVPISTDVVGSAREQGFITRLVVVALNITNAVVLIAWIWDLIAERQTNLKRRWAMWAFLVTMLAVLAGLHWEMNALMDVDNQRLVDRAAFRHMHRWYLRLSTVQWAASILFTYWTLQNWRATDRQSARAA